MPFSRGCPSLTRCRTTLNESSWSVRSSSRSSKHLVNIWNLRLLKPLQKTISLNCGDLSGNWFLLWKPMKKHAARFRRQPPVTLTVRFAIWQQTVATTWLTSWPVSISTTTCELWRRNRFSTKSLATNTQIQAWSTTWFWEPKSTVTRPRRAPLEST